MENELLLKTAFENVSFPLLLPKNRGINYFSYRYWKIHYLWNHSNMPFFEGDKFLNQLTNYS